MDYPEILKHWKIISLWNSNLTAPPLFYLTTLTNIKNNFHLFDIFKKYNVPKGEFY